MKIELLEDLPVATIHKCTKGKIYDNAIKITCRVRGRLGAVEILADSGYKVVVLVNEYKVLEDEDGDNS